MERSLMLAQKYQHLSRPENTDCFSENEQPPNNITRLPSVQVKSGAIESLLSQNEDLSARLKVLLRRLASIEEENLRLTQEHREMKNQFTGLTDQVAVYREKEYTWRERTIIAEETLDLQQAEVRQKEVEFAKLRAQEWEMREHLQTQLNKAESAYHRLLRYRARVRNWARPAMKSLIQQLKDRDQRLEHFKREVQNTEIQCQNLIQKNQDQVKKSRDIQRALEDEKLQLIAHFEQQREDLKTEIASLHEITSELRRKAALLDRSLERQDYLENRLIFTERENQELRTRFTEEYESLHKQMQEWRSKAQALEIERNGISQQKEDLEVQYKRTKEVADRLDEQMDALRLLWKEKVHENERLRASIQSVEAINSELSVRINELSNQNLIGG